MPEPPEGWPLRGPSIKGAIPPFIAWPWLSWLYSCACQNGSRWHVSVGHSNESVQLKASCWAVWHSLSSTYSSVPSNMQHIFHHNPS